MSLKIYYRYFYLQSMSMMEDKQNQPHALDYQEICCVICKLGFEDEEPITVTKKSISTLIKYSEMHGCSDLGAYLIKRVGMTPVGTALVHKKCCRNFTDKKRAMQNSVKDIEVPCAKKLRSSPLPFNW